MNLDEIIRDHIEITKATKFDACERNGGPSDLNPMVIWIDEEEKTSIAVVEAKGNTTEYMPKVLGLLAKQSPKVIIFMAESLAKSCASQEEFEVFMKQHKPGDLKKLHNSRGPLSGVVELIAFNGIDLATGKQMQGVATFTYDDKGLPVFGSTEISEIPAEHIDKANMSWMFGEFYEFMKSLKSETN